MRRPASKLGMRAFLEDGGFKAFTTTFEDLHGLAQLPGLAVQRLMADGYGFGAEGDWKTAALVRAMKVMGAGLEGGTSFMEDYTYHLDPRMRPRCWARTCSRSARRSPARNPALEIHPLVDWRQSRPAAPGVRRPQRPGGQRLDDRHGQPLPHDRQRGGCGPAGQAAAQAAGGPRGVGAHARTSRPLPRPGSWPAARTTPASARRSPPNIWRTSPRWPVWSIW